MKALENFEVNLTGSELLWLIQAADNKYSESVDPIYGENAISEKWKMIGQKLTEAYQSKFEN